MKLIRYLLLLGGLFTLGSALGFIFQAPFVLRFWPWPDGRLSYLFIGSILAAVSAAAFWIGWTGDFGALPAGSLNIFVIAISSGLYFFVLILREGRTNLYQFSIWAFGMAIISGAFFLWSRTLDVLDSRPTPRFVRVCFEFFLVALLFSGTALILKLPILPWKLNPDSSVIFGCIFLGDAFYFLYALLMPRLSNAIGQLLSFLAYDLVLIGPFLKLFTTVGTEFRISLILYCIVLLFSGAISFYYLFFNEQTRGWLHNHPGS